MLAIEHPFAWYSNHCTVKSHCGGLTLTGCLVLTKATLSLPSSDEQERENKRKISQFEIRAGRDHSPSQNWLHSWLLYLVLAVVQGNGGAGNGGLQSVHHMFSLLLLPPQGRTPYTLPLLQPGVPPIGDFCALHRFLPLSPSHRLQVFTNCCSVDSSGTGCSTVSHSTD